MTEKPRIGIFLHHLTVGGVQRTMLRLAGALAARDHDVDLVLRTATGELLDLVPDRVRIVDLDRPRVSATIRPLVRYLRGERPAAFLSAMCHLNVAALLAARLARTDTRILVREASAPETQRSYAKGNKGLRRAYRLVPYVYPWADRIIAPSAGVADELAHYFRLPRNDIDVVFNPVVDDNLRRLAAERADHPWFDDGGSPLLVGVGRFARQKDLGTMLRAFALVRQARAARLILLGDGPMRPELEGLARELGVAGDVAMPGFAINPYAWMSRAAVYVQTSLWEGFPNALVEALACGAPVVATACPSGPEEILDGGRYGHLTPMGDPEATARAILDAIASPRDRAELRARAEEFSIDRITDRYETLLLTDRAGSHRTSDHA